MCIRDSARPLYMFEQERLVVRGRAFAHAIGNLRNLQRRADRRLDALLLAYLFQFGYKFA